MVDLSIAMLNYQRVPGKDEFTWKSLEMMS
jgi:hypothetical protein